MVRFFKSSNIHINTYYINIFINVIYKFIIYILKSVFYNTLILKDESALYTVLGKCLHLYLCIVDTTLQLVAQHSVLATREGITHM